MTYLGPSGWLAILLLWILFFAFYRDYRTDRYRQKLFGLRDDLFDYAAQGNIRFDDEAYKKLRAMINGSIRFGHRLNLPYFLGLTLGFSLLRSGKDESPRFAAAWRESLKPLPAGTANHLAEVRRQLHVQVLQQVVLASPLLLVTVVAVVAVMLVKHASNAVSRCIYRSLGPLLVVPLDRFDWSAWSDAQCASSRVGNGQKRWSVSRWASLNH